MATYENGHRFARASEATIDIRVETKLTKLRTLNPNVIYAHLGIQYMHRCVYKHTIVFTNNFFKTDFNFNFKEKFIYLSRVIQNCVYHFNKLFQLDNSTNDSFILDYYKILKQLNTRVSR